MFKQKSNGKILLWGVILVVVLGLGFVSHLLRREQATTPFSRTAQPLISKAFLRPAQDQSSLQEKLDKVLVLKEVLATGNDNDPRIDQVLKNLDPPTKAAFRSIYRDLALEKRNSRGLIVFLLGRHLNEPEDFQFIKSVLVEEPCLSLDQCHEEPEGANGDGSPSDILLNYPQAVALESMELATKKPSLLPETKEQIRDVLLQGLRSKIHFVANRSRALLAVYEIDQSQKRALR